MPETVSLDLPRVLRVFGGPGGLHARVVASDVAPLGKARRLSVNAVRLWMHRDKADGDWTLVLLHLLRDAGHDPMSFLRVRPVQFKPGAPADADPDDFASVFGFSRGAA